MIRVPAIATGMLVAIGTATGNASDATVVETPAPVEQIIETSTGVFVKTSKATYALSVCEDKPVCMRPADVKGQLDDAPQGGLPDGKIAVASSGDIRQAWYARPTDRYGHAVLGDAIEAGSLIVETADGKRSEHILDPSYVFEDITPRVIDLDLDGTNEVVTIRSSLDRGAAIAIYGIADGALVELAASGEIGRSNRWLNIAGIADYGGSGFPAIAWIETPHIGGIFRMGLYQSRRFEAFSLSYNGFSNHFIGSRELGLSATGDFNDDGVPDIAIPSADRNSMVLVSRSDPKTIPLPGRVGHAVAVVGGRIVTADTDGRLIVIKP